MRQHRVFKTSININAQPDRVMEFLGDLRNQKSLHPLILKVQLDDESDPSTPTYTITDRIDFWLFSVNMDYRVKVLERTASRFKAYTTPGFGTTLVSTYTAERTEEGCIFREEVDIDSSCLLIGKIYRELSSAHTEMLNKMKKILEEERTSTHKPESNEGTPLREAEDSLQ